ncbi:MAG TPA: M23 family metallopeptidase [Campylobacterales bacterium]|nr:M23 family metallopeptidase [Campylobacterales bacterium]HIP41146.1 M23 family metallopeptidase [Campylobacterales bacterium]
MKILITIILLLFLSACAKKTTPQLSSEAKKFSYTPVGQLVPAKSGQGRLWDNYIYAPNIRFPLESAPAYINSQVYGIGGMYGARGSLCDKRNYQYPWNDNYCEKRGWGMPLCPSGKGHQGVDIRSSTCEKRKYYAVAVEKGVITYIGKYTVSLRGESGRTYRYLHLDSKSLQVYRGEHVKRGQRVGLISDNMGGTKTSIHLHFDMKQTILINGRSKSIFVPPYSSLVDAYKRLLQGRP